MIYNSTDRSYVIRMTEATTRYVEIEVVAKDGTPEDLAGYSATYFYRIGERQQVKSCVIQGNVLLAKIEAAETLGLAGMTGSFEARIYKGGEVYSILCGSISVLPAIQPLLTPDQP